MNHSTYNNRETGNTDSFLKNEDQHPKQNVFTQLVARVLRIEKEEWGTKTSGYIARFRGKLYGNSETAYDQLADSLKADNITPLFRWDEGKHSIILVQGIVQPRPSNPMVNVVLFIFTLISVLLAGAIYSYNGPVTTEADVFLVNLISNLTKGWPFAISMLSILLAHEFGHYLVARYHKTAVSLPYFLPLPFISPLGTMGAFIQLKQPPKNKRILLDIGIAGPIAGLIVAIPVLIIGLYTSEINQIPANIPAGFSFEGNSILYLLLKYLVYGEWLPTPAHFHGLSPLIYWIKYFFTGLPLPTGGFDVTINSIAWAGWAGLLVTSLNLIPAGQLDGGHLIYGLFGKRAQKIRPIILIILIGLGFFWVGWWLWAFIIFLLGRVHAEPLDQITSLDTRRKAVALLGLLIFILVFTPVPLSGGL